jgi:SAM-dependent methyltransferase
MKGVLDLKRAFQAAQAYKTAPDNDHYHRSVITDATEQFEEVETTLSHMYRLPTEALEGKCYGERLAQILLSRNRLKKNMSILEVGCGTGLLARAFLDHLKAEAPDIYTTCSYTMFDLSPALQLAQKENCQHHPGAAFLQGNILEHDFSDWKFDLILSNEVIADLPVELNRMATRLIEHYKLDRSDAPPEYLVNSGAIKFIKIISNLLKPGGFSFISEYGSESDYPVGVKLGNHYEFSIRYKDLILTGEQSGLKVEFTDAAQFLQFRLEQKVLSRVSYGIVSDILLPYLKLSRLERFPYSESQLLQALDRRATSFYNLHFAPLSKGRDLLNPQSFKVLLLSNDKS